MEGNTPDSGGRSKRLAESDFALSLDHHGRVEKRSTLTIGKDLGFVGRTEALHASFSFLDTQ